MNENHHTGSAHRQRFYYSNFRRNKIAVTASSNKSSDNAINSYIANTLGYPTSHCSYNYKDILPRSYTRDWHPEQ